tara:strand:- start:4519 stop:5019 length:501 start_codon:yes stop_codon:yes gene_type:complete
LKWNSFPLQFGVKCFVQIFIFLLSFKILPASTTTVNIGGQSYTVTYNNISYDGNESEFNDSDMPWWGSSSTAQTFANATNVNNVYYGYENFAGFGLNAVYYYKSNGSGGSISSNADVNDNINYAVSAVAVPAPLPVLGIIPVVGCLRRMRKRQEINHERSTPINAP